ncbi:MAG: bifunctional UDP-N-acetylmuramoyl-tripeptide:D-alanyl-D-alanine ligase/alanine racemase [Bacteroidetes bacterium]|nr:MAG: bifunctional UDP-N-acetylmuramoyl-tripeptide:D-alanyl-D-alanine ligase/alanine racemase [Bacteroidota bacterium]
MRRLIYSTFVFGLYQLSEIAQIIDGTLHGNGTVSISTISADTRTVQQAPSCLFFAVTTSKDNGHNYLPQAKKQGVAAAVVSEKPKEDLNFILVSNTLDALQKLAKYHRKQFAIPTIAITGSNGKTIVKEWVNYLLQETFSICKSPKSYNSQIGVPLSVWQLNNNYNLSVFEAGISQVDEMERLANIIQPTIGVFTHLGDAHAANFDSEEENLNEKLKLFKNCKSVVCSSNQANVITAIKALDKTTFTWGSDIADDVHVAKSSDGTFTLRYQNKSHQIKLPHNDKASIDNSFTAICTALVVGQSIDDILKKVPSLPKVDLRLQQVEGLNNNELILDYYNADFQSTVIALDFLNQQNTKPESVVILSDILQSNWSDEELYHKISTLLVDHKISSFIGIGERISRANKSFLLPAVFYSNTNEFLIKHPLHELKDQSILLKGSRDSAFEKIAERLRIKTHQTSLEVNLTRLKHNIDVVKSRIGPKTKIMAMVKALAYGSGGYQVAKLLENNTIDYLGVAYTDEATDLRSSGISLPIMVLNPDLADLTPYKEQNIEPVIYSFESLNKVQNSNIKIHIEFDTGMHRLGFVNEDLPNLLTALQQNDAPQVVSIFSHMATSDDENLDDFSHQQITSFQEISSRFEDTLGITVLKHLSNTAGIERFSNARFDMVRLGIGLYGISTVGDSSKLLPVSIFKSYITQIKTVPAGDGIGYGQYSKSDHDRKIAIVAVGYADGYNRLFSRGKGSFLIHEQEAKVVGNVCMDMTMCDVTNIVCKAGDEVIIFGDSLRVEDLAQQIGTIPYEILTNVSERVNRVFYQE